MSNAKKFRTCKKYYKACKTWQFLYSNKNQVKKKKKKKKHKNEKNIDRCNLKSYFCFVAVTRFAYIDLYLLKIITPGLYEQTKISTHTFGIDYKSVN